MTRPLFVLSSLVLALVAFAADVAPMTEEDVVRLFVGGASTEAILDEIRTRPAAFELAQDMLEELRLAGIPQAVIDAMTARMAELEPVVPETPSAPAAAPAVLRVKLNPDRSSGKLGLLRIGGRITVEMAENLGLPARVEGESFEDLAIFVMCRTATHVPDQWRTRSPLGRDFVMSPRHKMLAFVSGATVEDRGEDPDGALLTLEIPPEIEIDLAPDDAHDIVVGVAIQGGGRYYRFASATRDDVVLGDEDVEITAWIRQEARERIAGLRVDVVP